MIKFYYLGNNTECPADALPDLGDGEVYVVFIDNTVAVGTVIGKVSDYTWLIDLGGFVMAAYGGLLVSGHSRGEGIIDVLKMTNQVYLRIYSEDNTLGGEVAIATLGKNYAVEEAAKVRSYQIYSPLNVSWYFNNFTYGNRCKKYAPDVYLSEFNERKLKDVQNLKSRMREDVKSIKEIEEKLCGIDSSSEPVSSLVVGNQYYMNRRKTPMVYLKEFNRHYVFTDTNSKFPYAVDKKTKIFDSYAGMSNRSKANTLAKRIGALRKSLDEFRGRIKSTMRAKAYPWRSEACEVIDLSVVKSEVVAS